MKRWLLTVLFLAGCSTNGVNRLEEAFPVCASEEKQIIKDEGEVRDVYGNHLAYLDSKGYMTGGYGHRFNNAQKFIYPLGSEIHPAVADFWFAEDMYNARQDVQAYLGGVKVPPQIENVLTNMAFNLGRPGLFEFKKMKEAILKADWERMANEMQRSNWFSDVGDRAKRLVTRVRLYGAQGSRYCNEPSKSSK